jgi:hypothetical protein
MTHGESRKGKKQKKIAKENRENSAKVFNFLKTKDQTLRV